MNLVRSSLTSTALILDSEDNEFAYSNYPDTPLRTHCVVANPHVATKVATSESDLAPAILRSGLQMAIINHSSTHFQMTHSTLVRLEQ